MRLFLSITLLFSLTAYSKENATSHCDKLYALQDKGEKILSRCELDSEKIAAEVVKFEKSCSRIEGAPKEDCYIIRLCPKFSDQSAHQAPIILKRDVQADSNYCVKPGYVFLRDESTGFEATAVCEESTPTSAKLTIKGQSKDCPFEW